MSTTLSGDTDARPSGVPLHPEATDRVFGAAVGALAGVALGLVGGLIGIVAGALIGAVGGAGLADMLRTIEQHRSAHDQRVDEAMGIIGGDLGAAPLEQPAAYLGAYSAAAAGISRSPLDETPDEGPIPHAD